ncbi:hypothetical protein CFP56_022917 [Quercus suber]|uniref:Uncharacterized protein n=1 Tax=Quercus suber TaxID=58331 RepID=A0AAW0K9W5_QUESU
MHQKGLNNYLTLEVTVILMKIKRLEKKFFGRLASHKHQKKEVLPLLLLPHFWAQKVVNHVFGALSIFLLSAL